MIIGSTRTLDLCNWFEYVSHNCFNSWWSILLSIGLIDQFDLSIRGIYSKTVVTSSGCHEMREIAAQGECCRLQVSCRRATGYMRPLAGRHPTFIYYSASAEGWRVKNPLCGHGCFARARTQDGLNKNILDEQHRSCSYSLPAGFMCLPLDI